MSVKNDKEQLIERTIHNYYTALAEYDLANDAIKCWTPDTDIRTYEHTRACHVALFQGIERTLKLYLSIQDDKHTSLANLCNQTIKNDELNAVDLCCFVTCKVPRNQSEHNSRIVELKGYQRVLNNFYSLLSICFPDRSIAKPPMSSENMFDFESFYNNMGQFEEEFCQYVLVCDPIHDVSEAQIQSLMQIPWYIIMDFDGRSDKKGLKSAIDHYGDLQIIHIDINAVNTVGINDSVCQSGKTIYVGCEKNRVIPLEEKRWEQDQRGKKSNISSLITKTYSSCFPKIKLVCLKPFAAELRVVIDQFRDTYGIDNLEVLFLTDETGDQTRLEESCENLTIYNSEVIDVFRTLMNYTHLLPEIHKPKEIAGIWLPSRDIEPQPLTDEVLLENTKMYFEILHLECGKSLKECDEESFLKGKTASWEILNFHYDVNLVPQKKYKDFLKEITDSFTVYNVHMGLDTKSRK